jgi:hypothetical protein
MILESWNGMLSGDGILYKATEIFARKYKHLLTAGAFGNVLNARDRFHAKVRDEYGGKLPFAS